MSAIVEYCGVPVWMEALSWISMIEKVGSIKIAQSLIICGEVRRYPIENHTDIILMQDIDHRFEVFRGSIGFQRSKVSQTLIAP